MAGNSAFLSSGEGYRGKLLEFHKGCPVPFHVPTGNVGFLWNCCSIKGPHVMCRGEIRGLHGLVAGSLWFLSGCVSTWRTCSCLLMEVRCPWALQGTPRDSLSIAAGMNRASSPVEAGTSGFLSISDIHHGVFTEL